MRGRCSGLTRLFCSIRTKPARIIPRPSLIYFKAKPNDAASANEIIAEAGASLRADPSYARAYLSMANGELLLGHYEQAMSHLEQAMRISPTQFKFRNLAHGDGQSAPGATSNRCGGPGRPQSHRLGFIGRLLLYAALAAFYGAADKIPEAKAALAEAMKLNPKLSVAWFHAHVPSYINSPPGFREGLIKAGLPEE